jgi:DNA-binding LytR/AlgR family response regulator
MPHFLMATISEIVNDTEKLTGSVESRPIVINLDKVVAIEPHGSHTELFMDGEYRLRIDMPFETLCEILHAGSPKPNGIVVPNIMPIPHSQR